MAIDADQGAEARALLDTLAADSAPTPLGRWQRPALQAVASGPAA